MVRASDHKLVDVGPRSAHIGGLSYAVYTPEEEIVDLQLEFFSPKEGDPDDYVRIKLANGKRVTLTNSCAANILGYVKEGDYSPRQRGERPEGHEAPGRLPGGLRGRVRPADPAEGL